MNKKRFISFILVILIFLCSLPIEALAEGIIAESQNEEMLKAELRLAVDETKYPNGLFEFLATRMNTSENMTSVEFAIVRKGGTAGKASITFKAIDVSAKYGQDYTISVPKGILTETLPENTDAKPLMQSFEGVESSAGEAVEPGVEETGQGIQVEGSEYSVISTTGAGITTTGAGIEYEELPIPKQEEQAKNSGLRAAREAFTGKTSERRTWREVNEEVEENAIDLHKEMYEGVPGVTYTFDFADGEYIKKIRFNTIDDTLSEDEEQVVFAILNPVGGAVGESLNAFMNIEDNEEKERVEFEMLEEQISVDRLTGFAEVTVKRTAGLYRYGMIQVGTAALTAQPEVDYKPIATEVRFVPGQETQKVRVPLLAGISDNELQFLIKLDPGSPNLSSEGISQTVVTIQGSPRVLMQRSSETPMMLSTIQDNPSGLTTEVIDGKTYRVKTLTVNDIESGSYKIVNGKAEIDVLKSNGYSSLVFKKDLSLVEKISFEWANASKGMSVFSSTAVSDMSIGPSGSSISVRKRNRFQSCWQNYTLSPADKMNNEIHFATGTGSLGYYSILTLGAVKLYYKTFNVMLKALIDDNDAKITPKIWTSETTSENAQTEYIGALAFANDNVAAQKSFSGEETVYLAPKFADSSLDKSKVYLWGYKIERLGGLAGEKYYKVKDDKLNIRSLYTGALRDVNDNIIPINEVLMDNDTIVLLPIYKARNAFIEINFDSSKGGMAQNSFSNKHTLKIGMLDTVKFNAFANTGYFVSGYEHGHMNNTYITTVVYPPKRPGMSFPPPREITAYDENAIPSYQRERELSDYGPDYASQVINNSEYSSHFAPIDGININPALPNKLDFKPQKTYSKLTAQFSVPSLKVKVDPMSGDQTKGSVAFIPQEGEPQAGNSTNPMVISPIERNKAYTISGSPDEGYRMVWKNWSGDTNEDGILSEAEYNNIKEYENLFDRKAVNGSFYNYITNYDKPLIYYSFEPKPSGGTAGLVRGRVSIYGGNILGNTEKQADNINVKALEGVSVIINGHSLSTDKDGVFEIRHSDFTTNEYHTLVINYKGFNYTGYVNVNAFTEIRIEEYDSFVPYNFTAFDGNTRLDPAQIENRDANFNFRFDIKAIKPGVSANAALIRIYSKTGVQRGTALEIKPENGTFNFDFNPAANDVVPGDTMTVQFVDQNGVEYLEHNVGFYFKKYLDTFSLLSAFKSPAKPAIDLVGRVDAAFDLGLAGKAEQYIEKTSKDWYIKFGFDSDWEKSLSDGSVVKDENDTATEKLKDAAASSGNGAAGEQETKDTVEKAVSSENSKKKSASVTSDMKFGLSTALYLHMTLDEDPKSAGYGYVYFKEMILSATVFGHYDKKVEVMTPIGVTVFVGLELQGSITGMMVIEQYDYKKFYFNDKGEIDFSKAGVSDPNRDFTIYGRLIVKPTIIITAGAKISGATLTITGQADFNLDFTTSGSGSGSVTLSSTVTLEVLFFTYQWHIAQKSWDLFNYGQLKSINPNSLFDDAEYLYDTAENYKVMSREYVDNRAGWQGADSRQLMKSSSLGLNQSNEQTLQTGVYPYPYTLLSNIGENQQLLVFLDDDVNHDERNRTQLYYSVYNGTSWSSPQKVDNDNTSDGLPWICDMGDRVLVTWSSSISQIGNNDTIMEVLNRRNIKAAFFDKSSKTFGQVQEVTHETEQDKYSDSDPYIAYSKDEAGKENLMITYTKTEYKATGVNGAVVGDVVNAYSTLAYRFYDFDNNLWDVSGDHGDGYYGQGFIDVSQYVDVDESNILIQENDDSWAGYWSRVPNSSEVSIRSWSNNDPVIADSNAIGYKDYAVLAYTLDLDENLGTTLDRELFIQIYNFKDKKFLPPVRCTEDTKGQFNLEFERVNDNVYLYYISDGDIMSIDIGHLLNENFLQYEVNGNQVLVLNKLKEVHRKPETVVRHQYDIKKDESGNETRENEIPIDEFMVKADNNNVYLVWGENDITYKAGVDPKSEEASLPQNHFREHHIYAARQTISEETSRQLFDEDGITPLLYPSIDQEGNPIDYTQVRDINNEVGKVRAGDPVFYKSRVTLWSDPVKLTEGEGANYNDLDFVILPDGSLRVVFVKGFSETMDVAGKQMPVENVNNRSLMTADFDVNIQNATVEIRQITMPKQNEILPIEIDIQNLGLSSFSEGTIEIYQLAGNETLELSALPLNLRGGEKRNISLLWQAPENLTDTKLQVIVKNGTETICSAEQSIIAKSVIDITDATTQFVGRNRLMITGTAVNNGNIATDGADILAEVSGSVVGSLNVGSLAIGETKLFEFYIDIKPEMFKNTLYEDGSVTEVMGLTIHSKSGTGKSLSCERHASWQDIDTINNISTFELKKGGTAISDNLAMYRGNLINIEPSLTYIDNTLQLPRIIYVSSNEEVADFSQGAMTLLCKKTGTTTITAYALPQKNEIILSKNRFVRVENLSTLAEAAIKVKSFVVNVVSESYNGTLTEQVEPKTHITTTGNTTTVTITTIAKAVLDELGKAVSTITTTQISKAVSKAIEELTMVVKNAFARIEIKVEAPEGSKTIETSIKTSAIKEIINSKIQEMTISSSLGTVTFDTKALTTMVNKAVEDVKITISRLEGNDLSSEAQKFIGNRPVFNLSVISEGKTISPFNGSVTVSVPYTPKANEDTNAIVIYGIDDKGQPKIISNSVFDSVTQTITFKTSHLTQFAVGYNKVSFNDVAAKAWYSKAVAFIAARGITTGTGDSKYSPEAKLTRAQFLVMVMKAYGITPDKNSKDNFSDAGNTYYTDYLAAAKKLGISGGVGDNMYAPNKEITRQEMFTLLYNTLKSIGDLPTVQSGKALTDFTDTDLIAPWAKEAMTLFAGNGIINGGNGKLNPTDTSNRAQMAQVLYNLLSK